MKGHENSSEPVRIANILFATDFSDRSEKARHYTRLLASRLGARVLVLHAIEDLEIPEQELDEQLVQWKNDLERSVKSKLDRLVAFFAESGVEVEGQLIWGKAWSVIFSAARAGPVDLIVVGSHGVANRQDHLVLGTTSHKVALASPVPVLIVRAEAPQDDPN